MKLHRIPQQPPKREKSPGEQRKEGNSNRSDTRNQNTGPRRTPGGVGPNAPSGGEFR